MRVHVFICLLAAGLSAGCPDRSIATITPVQTGATTKGIPVDADIDILFVIDNSASTRDKQTVFASNFPRFVQALDAFPTGRPNVHVGVVSTSVGTGSDAFGAACQTGDDGALQAIPRVPGCTPPTGTFLSDIKDPSGTRITNYSGTLDQALSCIAQLGATGCGFEAPLQAMELALDPEKNPGFLRRGAFLAVIFLTDEDDCSVADRSLFSLDLGSAGLNDSDFRCQPLYAYQCDQPISATGPGMYTNCKPRTGSYLQDISHYYDFLTSVKDPSQIVVAAIAGDPSANIAIGPLTVPGTGGTQALALQPSCHATINGNDAIGRPAIRIADFVSRFGSHGLFDTVCQSDYSGVLTQIGDLLFEVVSPCLEGPIDTTDAQPDNPGLQPQCTVSDVVESDPGRPVETGIDVCPMSAPDTPAPGGPRPCWWVKTNPGACTTDTGLELHVERTAPPAPGTTVEVSCAISSM